MNMKWLNFAIIGTGRAEQVGLAMIKDEADFHGKPTAYTFQHAPRWA
jgi:hypothetical protein